MLDINTQSSTNILLGKVLLIASIISLLPGCASTEIRPDQPSSASVTIDPYEDFNRSMYGFNMGLDKYLLKPVADGYKFITPRFMQTGVSNFFNNLKGINVVINDMLQGKFEQGAADTGRFLTNTTIGIGGFVDVASELGLQSNVEDFGQTLAVWGVNQGPYLVLPIMGPTTLRDGTASLFDRAANPGSYAPMVGVLEGINDRANADGALNFINEAALDPYVFTRESFLQYRSNLVKDGLLDSKEHDFDINDAVDEAIAQPGKSPAPTADKHGKLSGAAKPSKTLAQGSDAFDDMSKSFERAEYQFEKASAKVDQLSKKKRRKH
ncbi:MAG: VacJ family lipoprotein [Methylomonas sp.]|nr:VacJ family lipoprotein [Methylomonas sp.]PPD21844.1 MAG: ABC transporter [Methylomonas sp.]PPD27126.1 MAG: ABC transporter [Methylomonas sp.]PPD39080.1 MAG: ABC transporter [Methylomonas sp.]PPD42308.1 MAG: ABC transporter [Methylomonas sp.]